MKKYFVLLTVLMTVLTLTACTAAADFAMPAAFAAPAASKAPVQEPVPAATAAPQSVEAAPQPVTADVLSPEAAQAAALAHAGLTADEVTHVRTHLDYDDGRREYEVEFYCGDREYDYDIDALTGDIRSFDSVAGHCVRQAEHKPEASAQNTELLAEAEAKAIALEHAGIAEANARFHKVHLDTDDGRREYDIEFRVGNVEYEYEIDAQSGRILDHDKDYDD